MRLFDVAMVVCSGCLNLLDEDVLLCFFSWLVVAYCCSGSDVSDGYTEAFVLGMSMPSLLMSVSDCVVVARQFRSGVLFMFFLPRVLNLVPKKNYIQILKVMLAVSFFVFVIVFLLGSRM